ncbi:MAG TPA: hypothetical protein VN455_06795, partial [Methanotrichaceae archaeon]|nr:hypothetical protein [Methanotrichaceae archaeon]
VLDGLLALNIDLSMDAVAIRLGMWDWGNGFDYQYFGVPYNNFWAWFWVVFSFSFSLRLLSKLPGFWGRWFSPAGAIICGTAGVIITNRLITSIPIDLVHICCHHRSLGRRYAIGAGTAPKNLGPVSGCIYLPCAAWISCLFPDRRIGFESHSGPAFSASCEHDHEYDSAWASSKGSELLVPVQNEDEGSDGLHLG